jgi:[acyl-carrier-protein] S-malonyltransferase
VCDVANDNAPGQVVVSGDRAAVERAVELAKARGARRSVLLPVSAPFHCRLLRPAAEALEEALAAVDLAAPVVPLVSNVRAAPERDPEMLKRLLVEQVTARVRWRESLLAMAWLGIGEIIELGAGRVLAGLAKRALPEAQAAALGSPEEIDAWLASQA